MSDDDPRLRRRSADRIQSRFTLAIAIITLVGLIFSLGANYQKLVGIDLQVQKFIAAAEDTYVRQDVSASQWNSVDYRLRELQKQVDTLTDVVMAQQRRDDPQPSPRFQR